MSFGMGGSPVSSFGPPQGGGDFQQNPSIQNPGGVPGMIGQLLSQYDVCVQCLKQLADQEIDEARGSKLQMMAAQLNQMKVDRKREVEQMQQQQARVSAGAM